jgi:hypothetical protein
MWIGRALIWWGRISLGLLLVGLVRHWSDARANLPTGLMLLSWPLTFLFLLIVFWNHKFRWPFGRLLYPALVPMFLLWILGWYYAFPARWQRFTVTLGAGALVLAGILLPFVSLYPLFHPWRSGSESPITHPVGTIYTIPETGEPVAQLVSYHLIEPYAVPETYFPLELCWKPLSRTDTPQSVFVQLLDLSPLEQGNPPAVWGRRETYPGLGNLPTDRWALGETFCDTLLVWVYEDTPTPLGAAIEVGFIDRETGVRLQTTTAEGDPMDLAFSGSLSILADETVPDTQHKPFYTWDDAIALNQVHIAVADTTTLTLTWQSRRAVPYDATMFLHVIEAGDTASGDIVAQVDRQPLEGRFPTSFWIPGQVITDVVTLPPVEAPSAVNLGLYTWPSLQRLPVVDVSGSPQPGDMIVLPLPAERTGVTWP